MQITFKFSQLWYIYCFRQPKTIKNTFQATTFNVEENSRTFQGLVQKFKNFPRTSPKIQGLVKTVRALELLSLKRTAGTYL